MVFVPGHVHADPALMDLACVVHSCSATVTGVAYKVHTILIQYYNKQATVPTDLYNVHGYIHLHKHVIMVCTCPGGRSLSYKSACIMGNSGHKIGNP